MSCDKTIIRLVLSFLFNNKTLSRIYLLKDKKTFILKNNKNEQISFSCDVLKKLVKEGLLQRQGVDALSLTEKGKTVSAGFFTKSSPSSGVNAQGKEKESALCDSEFDVQKNFNESPLFQLRRRKGKDGTPFLNEKEFNAGERLRCDYTRGQLLPRIGMNWIGGIGLSSLKSGQASGFVEMTESTLAARIRVEKAIKAVGPELSGILIDVCCFLKGLETVEIERQWPVRSAKIVLKAALSALSRHYEPVLNEKRKTIVHWGSSDYKPRAGL